MRGAMWACGYNIFYPNGENIFLVQFYVFTLDHDVGIYTTPEAC